MVTSATVYAQNPFDRANTVADVTLYEIQTHNCYLRAGDRLGERRFETCVREQRAAHGGDRCRGDPPGLPARDCAWLGDLRCQLARGGDFQEREEDRRHAACPRISQVG